MISLPTAVVVSGLLFSLAASSPCAAQEDRRQKQEQSPQENSYHDQAQITQQDQQQKGSAQSIPGRVSEKHGRYYLEEDLHKTSYELQGAWELKQFLGKKVRVTGTVDSDHNILRVIAITKIP